MAGLKRSQHLKLELKDIQEATKNFEMCIGSGGFGKVYRGEITVNDKPTKVAVKRISRELQGSKEFLNEIDLLTGQRHPNIIPLLGYCDEGQEKIIVYEYAKHGSLDRYIRCGDDSTCNILSWVKRLKICVDAARGLDHLHRHIIHRDIKSSNILLDENWVAKISDFGLSKLIYVDRSGVITNPCGTPGYCEPEYIDTGIVMKESDIFSFGLVLFEVMCGRLCTIREKDGLRLSHTLAKKYYQKGSLDAIIDPYLREQMCQSSLEKFSKLAYECLKNERAHRPPMDEVTKELEEALKIQEEYDSWKKEEEYWKTKLPDDSEEILERFNPPVKQYSTRKELFMLLHKGFFFDNDERFFSINDDGRKCEIISAKRFVKQKSKPLQETPLSGQHLLRDESTKLYPHTTELNLYFQISTSMLSIDTMYAASLVFSFKEWDDHSSLHIDSSRWVWIKWKCEDLCASSAHFAIRRDDGNFETTLWHFFSRDKNSYFDIILNRLLGGEEEKLPCIIIHRLEFHPLKMASSCFLIKQFLYLYESTFDQDFNHENKLRDDYEGMICRTDPRLKYNTQEDLYVLLCAGILIDNGRKWFCICKSTGQKCHMLAAVDILRNDSNYELMDRLSLSESRFKEGIQLQNATQYYFTCELEADMFSSGKLYEIYLVFKFVNGGTKPDADCMHIVN
ncbi:hypothetical protein R6Q57_004234 [Mikania cordata]